MGTAMTFVALPWFVLSTTGSAPKMSVVLAVEIAPVAIFGIPSGSVVARLGARTMMLVSDALRAPLIALVPLLSWTGHLAYGLLLVLVFLIGLFSAPYIASAAVDHPGALRRRRGHGLEGVGALRHRHPAADRDRAGARGRARRVDRCARRAADRRRDLSVRVRRRAGRGPRRAACSAGRRVRGHVRRAPLPRARPPARPLDPDGRRARRCSRCDRRRGAARRVHALRPERARRRLAVHQLRRRCDHRLGPRDEGARPRTAAAARLRRARACHAAVVGDRGSDLLARRLCGRRLLRCLRGHGERADDGTDHHAPAVRPARQGADLGDDRERSRRSRSAASPSGPSTGSGATRACGS